MNQSSAINDSIHRGLLYLEKKQQVNGSFVSDSSPRTEPWQAAYQYKTTFVPALLLSSLSQLDNPVARTIRDKLASFLLAQKSQDWSFNYWAQQAPERHTFPYPDDLDDTFCALLGLYYHDPSLIDETVLARMVKLLVATETKVGGPYRTWLVAPTSETVWQDIDLAVNANVATFVTAVSNSLPNLVAFLEQHIKTGNYTSPYYPSSYPIWYYLARAYQGSARLTLQKAVEQQWQQANKPNALDTALVLNTLLQLSPQHPLLPALCRSIIRQQQTDGSWPAAAFCLDPTRRQQRHYHGSAALTTGFALEALARFSQTQTRPVTNRQTIQAKERTHKANQLHQQIVKQTDSQFTRLRPHVRRHIKKVRNQLLKSDPKHEITLLPYLFAQFLTNPKRPVPQAAFVNLGLANLYGWIAYTIYDDFLDDEGDPKLLSAANVALRSSLLHFQRSLPKATAFQQRVEQTFDTIDDANTWEVTSCRFAVVNQSIELSSLPHFGHRQKLAERSLGHGLTPLAILVASSNVSLSSQSVEVIDQAFRQYLIARQLNDDAHDWKEDVQKGHITYVVAAILRGLDYTGKQPFRTLLPAMEKQFWHHTLPKICHDMEQHIIRGQRLLRDNPHLQTTNLLTKLLKKTYDSIQKTKQTQYQAIQFLENYRSKKINS